MANTGVMLAFFLGDEDAQRLALPNGEAPEQLHITLVYFGNQDEVENTDKLPAVVQSWAQDKAPITGKVNGGGQFSAGPDGRTPLYANFDAPELPAWRQSLAEHVSSFGYEPKADHGYTPHITLTYSEAGETPPPLPEIPELPITFDVLTLMVAGERHDFPLNVQEVIRKQSDGWHLYSKDGKKHLGGPYSSRTGAEERERQVQFFKQQESDMQQVKLDLKALESYRPPKQVWATREQIEALCPDCGRMMEKANLSRLNLAALEAGTLKRLQEAIDDPHFFTKCMKSSLGGFKPSDKAAFCAWFSEKITGEWPAESMMMDTPPRMQESWITELWPITEGQDFTGHTWAVTIIGPKTPADLVTIEGEEYVRSSNGRLYACDALRESAPSWDGVKVYDNHLTDAEFEEKQGMRSAKKEWMGNIVSPLWDAPRRSLQGVFKVVDDDLAGKLLRAFKQKVLDTIGLSIDTSPEERAVWHEGKQIPAIHGFRRIFSVDIVPEPAAGGKFNRILAGVQQERTYEMEEMQAFVIEATREIATAMLRNGKPKRAQQGLCTPGVRREVARLRETLNQAGVALEALESNLSK